MKIKLFGFALATTLLVTTSAALAADMPGPPAVDDLRQTYDWTGAYVGVFGAATAIDGHYTVQSGCGCGGGGDPEMSGIGYQGGVLAGINYQVNSFVFGVEGDWGFGGKVATNDDPGEATWLKFNDIATLRARAGLADGNTLFYITGGAAAVNSEFGGLVGPASVSDSQKKWLYGWTAGAGIEHAFTPALHARLEYLYLGLPSQKFTLSDGAGSGGTVNMKFKNTQMVRAALTYNFSW